jgi:glycosyltransferase involved in cell wall biosynthesis
MGSRAMNQELPRHQAGGQRTILPILVLYNTKLENSGTYQTFVASSRHGRLDTAQICVYDNSQARNVSSAQEAHLLAYKHDPDNPGIAAAYNWALDIAQSLGFSWLLLLDQDSKLPPTFLASLATAVEMYDDNQSVAAIVPLVTDKGATISPKRVRFGRLTPLPEPAPATADYEVTAINSGVAVKSSFVASIGGFNQAYRLDCLDHWLFRKVYANAKKAAISGYILDHSLSVSDYRHQVSLARYRSILSAETLFVTTEKRWVELLMYVTRLMLRAAKQVVIYRRLKLAALTCATVLAIIARRVRPARCGL